MIDWISLLSEACGLLYGIEKGLIAFDQWMKDKGPPIEGTSATPQ
jgi:hypothetical protein